MKKILKIISVLALTSVTTINVSGCDIFQRPAVDYQQLLADAAALITNNSDPNFTNFLKSKNKNNVSDFVRQIIINIKTLFDSTKEDFSNLIYEVTNNSDQIKETTIIKIKLIVDGNSAVKNCSFQAHFSSLQEHIDKILKPLVAGTKYLTIDKDDVSGIYAKLISAGADFKGTQEHYLRNDLPAAKKFWKEFQENPLLLINVLGPLLDFIQENSPPTDLTFDNFKPFLLNIKHLNDVIAITGNKKFGDNDYDYIKIGLEGKNSATVDLGHQYQGLTFVFINKNKS